MSQMEDCSASGSTSTVSENGNFAVSSEDSSRPDEIELDLGLGLSIGKKTRVLNAKDSSISSLSSSLSRGRTCLTAGINRAGDPMAVANGTGEVVGWPPIRTHRKNSMVNQANKPMKIVAIRKSISTNNAGVKMMNSLFVKVNMDGIPIGRKVDLGAHNCYKSLTDTLEKMFLKPVMTPNATRSRTQEHGEIGITSTSKPLESSTGFVLTYEDKEGDWMLAGDIPWQMFLISVRRLRIMRTCDATGISEQMLDQSEKFTKFGELC